MSVRTLSKIGLQLLVVALFLYHVTNIGGDDSLFKADYLGDVDRYSYDMRVRATAPNTVNESVIIADIDEKSLEALGRWPWSRHILADLMDTLFDHYNIKVIGFDIIFAEPDVSSGLPVLTDLAKKELRGNQSYQKVYRKLKNELQYDRRFADAIKDRNVVLGYVFENNVMVNDISGAIEGYESDYVQNFYFPQRQGFISNIPLIQNSSPLTGFFDNPSVDADGVFRRVPGFQIYEGSLYPSLAVATTMASLDTRDVDFGIWIDEFGGIIVQDFKIGSHTVPTDIGGNILVPYRGSERSFPYVSIIDILEKNVDKALLENKILLLGTSAAGLLDLRSTPVGEQYPGVEVHANIVAGILEDNIHVVPDYTVGLEILLIILISVIMMGLQSRIPPIFNIVLLVSIVSLLVFQSIYFWGKGLVMPGTNELFLAAWLFVVHMSFGYVFEFRGKKVMAKQFGQYVPPEIVDEMSENPGELSLEGQSKNMTVLFSDVRGFTTISEGLNAKELTELMNQYLTPMTEIIHHNRGTIDKYIGDAIMAFWGAPLEEPQHARLAIDASMAMLDGLSNLNKEFSARGWPQIQIGIGLNTGEMNVGNMGSDFRMAYTVLGDAVNLGARLEGLTKQYGVSLMVSESTKAEVPEYAYIELDQVRVKGKNKPVKIYQPLCLVQDLNEGQKQLLGKYQIAMESYRDQKWDLAEEQFKELKEVDPDRLIYDIYLERVNHFQWEPPGDDWDGVFTHTSK